MRPTPKVPDLLQLWVIAPTGNVTGVVRIRTGLHCGVSVLFG